MYLQKNKYNTNQSNKYSGKDLLYVPYNPLFKTAFIMKPLIPKVSFVYRCTFILGLSTAMCKTNVSHGWSQKNKGTNVHVVQLLILSLNTFQYSLQVPMHYLHFMTTYSYLLLSMTITQRIISIIGLCFKARWVILIFKDIAGWIFIMIMISRL